MFSLWEGQRCFLLKAGNGRTLACKNFVLQTNRSGKENNLEINGLSCPNLHPKDLVLVWAPSDSRSHWCQTPKHIPICELFTGLGVGWKDEWVNSGWGYPGSPRQSDLEYFWVQLFWKSCLTSFQKKSKSGPTLLIILQKNHHPPWFHTHDSCKCQIDCGSEPAHGSGSSDFFPLAFVIDHFPGRSEKRGIKTNCSLKK